MKQLQELLDHFKIDKWDYLLIGDGSGSQSGSCGWSCLSIEKTGYKRKMWYGCMSDGTINVAEYMAYIQPLINIAQRKTSDCVHVHIITDSQVVAAASNKYICGKFLANFLAWGIIVKTHWLPRETIEANRLVDLVSKAAREDIKQSVYTETALSRLGKESIYEIEPIS